MSEDGEQPIDQLTDAEDVTQVDAPSDERASTETPGEEAAASGRQTGRWIFAVLAVALIAALAVSNVVLWRRSTDASDDLARLRRQVANFSVDLSCNSFGGSGAAGELCSRIDDAQSEAEDAHGYASEVEASVDDIRDCVNRYMDVIAAARGGSYRYQRC